MEHVTSLGESFLTTNLLLRNVSNPHILETMDML